MKTRIIKTRVWGDKNIFELSKDAKLLFMFLITCPEIGLTGAFELQDEILSAYTKIPNKEIKTIRSELIRTKRVYFDNGWYVIKNAMKHNNYFKSPKNCVAYLKERMGLPKNITKQLDTTIDTTIYTTYKSRIRNKKPKTLIRSKKEDLTKAYEESKSA